MNQNKENISIGLLIIFLIIGSFALLPIKRMYNVWAQSKEGQAELAKAQFNRQIKTLEAKACEESAQHLAQSEIIRAKGVAEANRIIGDSLKGNEAYLRYLWLSNLECKDKEIIYIPTEANMPILEAGRLK